MRSRYAIPRRRPALADPARAAIARRAVAGGPAGQQPVQLVVRVRTRWLLQGEQIKARNLQLLQWGLLMASGLAAMVFTMGAFSTPPADRPRKTMASEKIQPRAGMLQP